MNMVKLVVKKMELMAKMMEMGEKKNEHEQS